MLPTENDSLLAKTTTERSRPSRHPTAAIPLGHQSTRATQLFRTNPSQSEKFALIYLRHAHKRLDFFPLLSPLLLPVLRSPAHSTARAAGEDEARVRAPDRLSWCSWARFRHVGSFRVIQGSFLGGAVRHRNPISCDRSGSRIVFCFFSPKF